MVPEWGEWWCCLKPSWRTMFNFMGGWLALPDPVVAWDTYVSYFEANIAPQESWLFDYFNTSFEVTHTTVTLPGGIELDAAVWTLTQYLSFQLFVGTETYGCSEPCRLTFGIFAVPG